MRMVVSEAEERGNCQRPRPVDASSGWMPAPSHQPPRSTSATATAGLYDPRVEIDAAAPRRTAPFARESVIGDIDEAVCEAVPMMMAPPPAQAQCQAQYNNDEEGAGGDALPLSENQNIFVYERGVKPGITRNTQRTHLGQQHPIEVRGYVPQGP